MEHADLTGKIIACAIEVHKKLGPGFIESLYQNALPIELKKQGLKSESQKEIKVYYDGIEIGTHRLDLIIDKKVIVELKAVIDFNDSHAAQLRSYLKATGIKVGLLINFGKSTLAVKRVVN